MFMTLLHSYKLREIERHGQGVGKIRSRSHRMQLVWQRDVVCPDRTQGTNLRNHHHR
jgi:hypothetical protein